MTVELHNRSDDASDIDPARISRHQLPPTLERHSKTYDRRIGQIDPFLWKWIHRVLPHVTLSTVPQTHRAVARDAKTVASMLVVALLLVLVAGSGVAKAGSHPTTGLACPSDSPNVGYDHASPIGSAESFPGIATAAHHIGCEMVVG